MIEAMTNQQQLVITPSPPTWHPISSPYTTQVEWTPELHDAVVFGDTPCPYCKGDGQVTCIMRWGETDKTERRQFPCRCERARAKRKLIEQILPIRYRRMNLWTMKPSTNSRMPLQRQNKILEFLKKQPDASYLLYGPPGTSKTTFATALVRRAIERDFREHFWSDNLGALHWKHNLWIRYVNWDSLIDEYMAHQNNREAPPPSVTTKLIREAAANGRRPVLCIEEIDKAKLTEYRAKKLFELVCALDECQGQLIITTNFRTAEGFEAWLSKTDNQAINLAGEPLWRRISDNCTKVRFTEDNQ